MRQFTLPTVALALAVSMCVFAHGQVEYADVGVQLDECVSCEPGIPVCSRCLDACCDGNCHRLYRRLGFLGGALYDVPLEGTFHTAQSLSTTAGALGVDPLVLPGGTALDLNIGERGFNDLYDGFFGWTANITLCLDRSTKMYVGYRNVQGNGLDVEVGEAIIDPAGAATAVPIRAQFDDYREWGIQIGFITSKAMHKKVELLWGGRGGVGFVDDISGTFTIPNTLTLNAPFYENTTNLAFGVNLGVRWNLKPNFSLVALTGAEYRTKLSQDDTVLSTIGLQNLNDGSGFASLPILLGGTINF